MPPIPVFGGGDCYSSESYWDNVEKTGVDGVMLGRGALIKPWIFTEVKERREWDISARERLDLIRTVSVTYVTYLCMKFTEFLFSLLNMALSMYPDFFHCHLRVLMWSCSHFGSDTTGINTTRRYLCESLSFQYRYVPIGLLERLPGRINDRAPAFRGRDELGKRLFLYHFPPCSVSVVKKPCWQAVIVVTG